MREDEVSESGQLVVVYCDWTESEERPLNAAFKIS